MKINERKKLGLQTAAAFRLGTAIMEIKLSNIGDKYLRERDIQEFSQEIQSHRCSKKWIEKGIKFIFFRFFLYVTLNRLYINKYTIWKEYKTKTP